MSKILRFDWNGCEPRGDKWFRLLLFGIVAAYIFFTPSARAEAPSPQLVIVTSVHSRIQVLSSPLLRKIYMGSASNVGSQFHPLINQSDRVLHEMFLQKVLFMSQSTYERHLRHTKFSSGTVLPVAYRSEVKLIKYLQSHPDSITCMTQQMAAETPSLRVVMRL